MLVSCKYIFPGIVQLKKCVISQYVGELYHDNWIILISLDSGTYSKEFDFINITILYRYGISMLLITSKENHVAIDVENYSYHGCYII